MENERPKGKYGFAKKFPYCFKEKVRSSRVVYIGNNPAEFDSIITHHPQKFQDNTVTSSKYTSLNFLPKNLFAQFHRIANFYFLCVAITELVIDSPVSPATSIAPLIFVVVITAIKQGYEDVLRHRADRVVNNRPVHVLRAGRLQTIKSKHVQVGEIVQVLRNEEIPCDMVMLSSDGPEGNCYITTANLDGETSLKTFCCVAETRRLQTIEAFESFCGTIECQPPNANLYRFVGRINLWQETGAKVTRPLTAENLLLRGSRLKNTPFIYGCAVYTGQATKISLNYNSARTKFSRVERRMNTFLLVFLVMLLAYSIAAVTLQYDFNQEASSNWYLPPITDSLTKPKAAFAEFLSFMVLCNYLVPISMYVTVELQKFFGAKFFAMDREMYDPLIDEPAMALTSDLNEELGQIEYLFTDKTGTLTENCMVFRRCSVNGVLYEVYKGVLCTTPLLAGLDPEPVVVFPEAVQAMFTTLVLCHTVHVDTSNKEFSETGLEFEYQASSPDEKCLVEACRRFGTVYQGVRDDYIYVYINSVLKRFKLHHRLEFDPNRRRMSVIVEDENGDRFLYCKGADSAIMDRIVDDEQDQLITEHNLTEFAKLGLRTLMIANKQLNEDEFLKYDKLLKQAKNAIENREELLQEVYDLIENNLVLLGVTAIEDQLQEGVPEAILALREAGIQVWVLTGDKEETAVNVSYAAGHFHPCMIELRLTKMKSKEDCERKLRQIMSTLKSCSMDEKRHALIIDGVSLSHALDGPSLLMSRVCCKVVTVLCCRMTPIQKAKVVRMIKKSPSSPTTAAIGDGANDVSMIQEAHVGIGIFGKEGRQAARASDYAFARFRFIQRALLLHGHYFYSRIATLVQYFFYKNVAMITANFYFIFYSGFSGLTLLASFYLMFYNITFCSLPILLYGLFEQNIPQKQLLKYPNLYKQNRRNAKMSALQFLKWNALGIWHSLVFFYGTMFAFNTDWSQREDGTMFGLFDYGTVIITSCAFTVNLKLMIETKYWNWVTWLGYAITVVGFFSLCIVYSLFKWPDILLDSHSLLGSIVLLYTTPSFWLTVILLTVVALIPDIILETSHGIRNVLFYRKQCSKGDIYNPSKLSISVTRRSGKLTISQMNMIDT